ncbi:Sulfate adenylyltransferase [Perkinsus olseni]|uniref:sulfate adenylyltransferase n=1 Tax=Perkinsus olseni TaxID=32597 RepID=A0A7J6LJ14_PEROL|nr:Sulfate adenylyltransferase [Perkinsus olseni]
MKAFLWLLPLICSATRRGAGQSCTVRHQLNDRQAHDLEMLLVGGFAPLKGFMNRSDYDGVVERMRLSTGELWPLPVTLDTSNASNFVVGTCATLLDTFGNPVARLKVEDVWRPNKTLEALRCYGTLNRYDHPAVKYLMVHAGDFYVAGEVEGLQLPTHWDLEEVRRAPAAVRAEIARRNWTEVVAFQTRNPMHYAHVELVLRALRANPGRGLLLHPVVGPTKPDDIPYDVRFQCYESLLSDGLLPQDRVLLSALPLAMRLAGPREALLHAIIRRNYGATHFIVGRDHAGCKDSAGQDFYEPFAAADLAKSLEPELGITIITPEAELVYAVGRGYMPASLAGPDDTLRKISGTEMRSLLDRGETLPEWFTPPGVAQILRRYIIPASMRGLAVLVSGRSGSGKTTLVKSLRGPLRERRGPVTVLDGDQTRQLISAGLSHSREDRLAHAARMGYIAGEIVEHRGLVLLSLVAPYRDFRQIIRDLVTANGGNFLHIHMNTSKADCATRDRKSIYSSYGSEPQAQHAYDDWMEDDYEIPSSLERTDLFLSGLSDTDENRDTVLALLQELGLVNASSPEDT